MAFCQSILIIMFSGLKDSEKERMICGLYALLGAVDLNYEFFYLKLVITIIRFVTMCF